MIKNISYIGAGKILKFDRVTDSGTDSLEIPPADIANNSWVQTSASQFKNESVRLLVQKTIDNVWTADVMAAYKQSRECEIITDFTAPTITQEQLQKILAAVPELNDIKL